MKICTVCNLEKAEHDFFWRDKKAARRHSQCKQCYTAKRRSIWAEHYTLYGTAYRKRAVVRKRKIKNMLRGRMVEYLRDKACIRCGINDARVLEFDHIDPKTKSFGIARAITCTLSWGHILEEIAKCQILCANCHKIKTADEQSWYRIRIH
jgi:hypothetical protein